MLPFLVHPPAILARHDWGELLVSALPTASVGRAGTVRESFGPVANRSVLHPTRLETRTKESNMCASHGVVRNLKA